VTLTHNEPYLMTMTDNEPYLVTMPTMSRIAW